jgi:hypothetical protein
MQNVDHVWANAVNLAGLYSSDPIKCVPYDSAFGEAEDTDEYWGDDGEFCCPNKPGIYDKDRIIVFVAYERVDVEIWTNGVKAVMNMVSRWANAHDPS